MKRVTSALAVTILGLVTASCATTNSRFVTADEVSEYLIKQNPQAVQRALGEPRTVENIGGNRSVWTYHSDMIQDKKATQGKCEMIITFEGNKAVNVDVDATEYSPFAAPLATCNQMLDSL
ncbi:outer membrane protein assembly factor BamE domain-containing protein [Marinobacterium lutimaris]|nr:outer membrane protein assembly factor BamE [Marinobacterium lutimaris]